MKAVELAVVDVTEDETTVVVVVITPAMLAQSLGTILTSVLVTDTKLLILLKAALEQPCLEERDDAH